MSFFFGDNNAYYVFYAFEDYHISNILSLTSLNFFRYNLICLRFNKKTITQIMSYINDFSPEFKEKPTINK